MKTQDTYSKDALVGIIVKLKNYNKNIYNLNPVEFAELMKLKSNFLTLGIVLSDDKLSESTESIVVYMLDKLKNLKNKKSDTNEETINEEIKFSIEETLNVDASLIEEDRTEIRKHLFNENINVVIERVGKAFNVSWNSKMTTCKISIPSNWQVNMPQSLILDVDEKDNKFFASIDNQLSILGSFVYNILTRHSDYSVIKRMISLELEGNEDAVFKSIDKRKLNKLKNRGLSIETSLVLLGFCEQVTMKTFSTYTLLSILGFRKRLVNEFNDLIKNIE